MSVYRDIRLYQLCSGKYFNGRQRIILHVEFLLRICVWKCVELLILPYKVRPKYIFCITECLKCSSKQRAVSRQLHKNYFTSWNNMDTRRVNWIFKMDRSANDLNLWIYSYMHRRRTSALKYCHRELKHVRLYRPGFTIDQIPMRLLLMLMVTACYFSTQVEADEIMIYQAPLVYFFW